MGWTGTPAWDKTTAEVVKEEIEGYGGSHKIVKRVGKFYAVETVATGKVFAVVALTERKDGWVYTKLVDESMGPGDLAPASILKMLSPLDEDSSEYAVEWRERSWAAAKAKATAPKITQGTKIKFAKPITFSGGTERDELIFEHHYTFSSVSGWGLFRLPKDWKTRYEWEVVS